MSIDSSGNIHNETDGRFAGRVQHEGDADEVLRVPYPIDRSGSMTLDLADKAVAEVAAAIDGGDIPTLGHPMSTLTWKDFMTSDEYDFARETLGDEASDDEVEELVIERAKVAHGEYVRELDERYPEGVEPLPQPHVDTTTHDWLADSCAGTFVEGYTEEDVDDFAANLNGTMEVRCVWDRIDEWGFGGDSEMVGRVGDGPWRPMSSEFWTYLTEAEEGDPVPPKLLSDRPFESYVQPGFDLNSPAIYRGYNIAYERTGVEPGPISPREHEQMIRDLRDDTEDAANS